MCLSEVSDKVSASLDVRQDQRSVRGIIWLATNRCFSDMLGQRRESSFGVIFSFSVAARFPTNKKKSKKLTKANSPCVVRTRCRDELTGRWKQLGGVNAHT